MTLARHLEELGAPRPLAADVDTGQVGDYHAYRDLVEAWRRLEADGARGAEIGRTVQNTPMFSLEIGPVGAEKVSAIMAGIHPIEWIGVETMLLLLRKLVDSPPTDRRVIAFPLVNVDGYRKVENDLRAGKRRWRRTNRNGVDLNRNWPTHFRRGKKRRGLFGGYNFGGPAPRSEPEVDAVCTVLDGVASQASIDVALSLHSIGRMILYPYGGRWAPPAAEDQMLRAAGAVQSRLPRRYKIRQSARWVPGAFAHGMEIDHLHERYGAVSLLIECSRGGASPTALSSLIHPFRIFNPPRPAVEAGELADALEPFVRGR
jgi:hypothetical protein